MNARQEFLEFVKDKPRVVCAKLEDVYYASDDEGEEWTLYEGYIDGDYERFLESIDFNYDDGYGSQHLGGTIWFEDGTFADRGEYYDGSEWWEYHKAPEKPHNK